MILKGAGLRFEIEGEEAGKKFAEWANNAGVWLFWCQCERECSQPASCSRGKNTKPIIAAVRQPKLEPYIFRLTPFLIIFSAYIIYIDSAAASLILLLFSFFCLPLMCCYNSNIGRDDHYQDKKQQQSIIIVNQHLIGIRSPQRIKKNTPFSLLMPRRAGDFLGAAQETLVRTCTQREKDELYRRDGDIFRVRISRRSTQ